MKHWSFLFSNINVINLAKYWWLIIVDIVTSIPIKDSIINILCLTFNHWDSIHIFCFTIKQAVTKKPQAVGLNHETWIIWGWPIAYNAFSGANEHPFFHPMCRIMADVRPIKTPAQLTRDFWNLMGFLVSGNVRNRGTPKKWHPWPTMTSFQANFHPLECKLMKGQALSWGPSASCLLLNSAIVGWWNPHVLLQSVQSQVLLLQCHKNPDLSHVLLLGSAPLGSPFLVASHEPTRGPSPLDRSWPRFKPGWDIPMKSHRKIWEHPL